MARKYLKMGLFSPPRYSIFSGDHGLLVVVVVVVVFVVVVVVVVVVVDNRETNMS